MIRVIRILPDNTGVLDRIADEVFDDRIDPDRLSDMLATPDHLLLVAVDGDLVVGQCLAMVLKGPDRAPSLYIDNLGVAPTHRRQKIGTELLRHAFAYGKAQGCGSAWLGIDPDSDSAAPFYQALGLEFRRINYAQMEL
ncbi:GNAT family N-acetyltransferase [Pseudooceanicola sp. C21-150M6]|uniref:GNAT family N-acetyltransferase n=1 Tax=Pseudooceanicola sp. C21-150M6 TaxID=3434355 RepID=UPI003D7FDA0E